MKRRDAIQRYHAATMHTPDRLRALQVELDWANQPNPFRHYEGAPVVDLPADAPAPQTPLLPLLSGALGPPASGNFAELLSTLLFHSAAISATRVSPAGRRYALRVNPSSGNLHPTEFHFSTHGLAGWPDGVYHYRPSQHMAEQRATGTLSGDGLRFVLTTIAWREAWKYGPRAYRYCLLDAGHAVEALVTAGRALGWDFTLSTSFDDDAVAEALRLAPDEWPLALVTFACPTVDGAEATPLHWTAGTPNALSAAPVEYPAITEIHQAAKFEDAQDLQLSPEPGEIPLPEPAGASAPFAATVRHRRSALDFTGGDESLTLPELAALLHAATNTNLYVRLFLFVHRVDGLAPGLYRYDQWTHTLHAITLGDQRVAAAALSLKQDLAGNAAVAFALAGSLSSGYRDLHIEAGRAGHRLYLAAEALGWQATGIGAFYDEAVREHLRRSDTVVYHFAIGRAVPDKRQTETSGTLADK